MEDIKVTISKDGLTASLTITAQPGSFPTEKELLAALQKAGVTYGIDYDKIKQIAEKRAAVYNMTVAAGKPPVFGKDATLKWLVPVYRQRERERSARVDFKQALFFHPVTRNQPLVVKTPASKGEDGVTVTGKPIPSEGRDISLPRGKNTVLSEDGLTLIAAIDGSAYWQNGLVNVDRVLHIKGDVNYATGNIKFNGPVIIDGDVRSGFRVEARDSIVIGGNVEAAHIYSQQGDVTITYGVVGKKRAKVLAGGNLTCGYLQDATVGVRGDLYVQHYIINCSVSAGGRVIVKGAEGRIRGGTITSEKGIEAVHVGSERNIYTELKILSQGPNNSQKKLWELSRLRTELAMRYSTLEKKYLFLNKLRQSLAKLSAEKENEIEYLKNELKRLKTRLIKLDDQEIILQKEAAKERLLKEIVVEGYLYPNVHVEINGLGFLSDETLQGVKIFRFKDELLVESLKNMEDQAYDIFVPER